MAAPPHGSAHTIGKNEREYLGKVDWLWNRLSPQQRTRIRMSMISNTLRQENSKLCFIGQASSTMTAIPADHENVLSQIARGFASTIFYDGPNYLPLLGRKATPHEKRILDDIYYAKIGGREHRYKEATELIRRYFSWHIVSA
ncbi:MAG: hypothetical protein KGI33_03555 [Thaumarchaeota archaeon]|nr:hypothetical protein [Nitrososphaerota archaeon]